MLVSRVDFGPILTPPVLSFQDEDQEEEDSSDTDEDDEDTDMDVLFQELETPDGAENREHLNSPTDEEVQSLPAA